jgi:dihydroflavonol-4-reductase
VVDAMLLAMEKGKWGSKYLLNGENISHKEVFELIAKSLGKKPPHIYVKPWITNIAWRLVWLLSLITRKSPSITRDTARSAHSKTYYSSAKASNELGIKFRSIADAVANTARIGRI